MASVGLERIGKSFGETRVLQDVSLGVREGEFLTLVGPSGCGKSTLIRIIAGLEGQDAGTVAIGGRPIDDLRPHERRVAMVFQSYALYPHMSVAENIGLPLVMARLRLWERLPLVRLLSGRRRRVLREIATEVEATARQLQLDHLLPRRPSQLSGGQRQRVALGRAMVRHPDVFLMDEPLSNLDAKLRVHMRSELAELHARLGATFIYVTHDQVEAMTMSDRIAMMDSGRIIQLGTPAELYGRPADVRVAAFIGSPAINLLPGRVQDDGSVDLLGRRLPLGVDLAPGSEVTIGIRPEALLIDDGSGPGLGAGAIEATLARTENLGPEFILHVQSEVPGGAPVAILARVPAGAALPRQGETVRLAFAPGACHLFDAAGDRIEPRPALAEARSPHLRAVAGERASA